MTDMATGLVGLLVVGTKGTFSGPVQGVPRDVDALVPLLFTSFDETWAAEALMYFNLERAGIDIHENDLFFWVSCAGGHAWVFVLFYGRGVHYGRTA